METIPITEAKARIAELADRVAREHDHFTITRNGRAEPTGQGFPAPGAGAGNATTRPLGCAGSGPP